MHSIPSTAAGTFGVFMPDRWTGSSQGELARLDAASHDGQGVCEHLAVIARGEGREVVAVPLDQLATAEEWLAAGDERRVRQAGNAALGRAASHLGSRPRAGRARSPWMGRAGAA